MTVSTPQLVLFDLDGTLTKKDTYLAYLVGFLSRTPARWPKASALPFYVLAHKAGLKDNGWLKARFLGNIFGGLPRSRIDLWTKHFLDDLFANGFRAEAIEALEAHQAAGDRVILLTASFDFYVKPLAKRLGIEEVVCTQSTWQDECLRGEIDGVNVYGPNKLASIERYLAETFDAQASVAYSDHCSDFPLLQRVTDGVMITDKANDIEQAKQRGFRVLAWK